MIAPKKHGMHKKATPKTTLMDRRARKPANKTGKNSTMYGNGKHG